jgi:hypothetical protein
MSCTHLVPINKIIFQNKNCANNVIIMVLMNNVLFSPYKSKVIR